MKLFGKELTIEEECELCWNGDLESYKEFRNSDKFDEVWKAVDELAKEVASEYIEVYPKVIVANQRLLIDYYKYNTLGPNYLYKLELMKGDN